MRRRLFFLMPDLASTRRMMDDLLLARVEERHIHVLARRGTSMQGLHEANVLQKSDLIHGAQIGLGIGAVLGVAVGIALVTTLVPDERWQIATVLGACVIGAVFGTWVSSMVGSSAPNSRLRQFNDAIDAGRILVMADVPDHRLNQVRDAMRGRHPDAEDRGIDPHIPAFP